MNVTVYLFGEYSEGYTQYPDDNSSDIFQKIISQAYSETQVVIHRDGNLMYYVYVRKFENGRYIGLCVILNDLYIVNIDGLFSLFENVVLNIVTKGNILQFNEDGEIVSSVSKLYLSKNDINSITDDLRNGFEYLSPSAKKLPPINYGKDKDSFESFTKNDDIQNIIRSSYNNAYTYIYKSDEYKTDKLNGYKGVIKKISSDNANLKSQIIDLESKIKTVQRQKKQIKYVIFLILLVLGCCGGIYFMNENLNNTQNQLDNANDIIDHNRIEIINKNSKIDSLNTDVYSLQQTCEVERNKRIKAEDNLDKISSIYPFIVTESSVSSSSFNFDYYASEERNVTVTLKAINENTSEVVTNSHNLTFYKGGGTKNLNFNYSLNSSYYYYVVLIYDGKIIAGKRW